MLYTRASHFAAERVGRGRLEPRNGIDAMKIRACIASLVMVGGLALAGCQSAEKTQASTTAVNQMCPIGNDPIDPANQPLTRVYKGKTIAFCCDGCTSNYDGMTDAGKAEILAKAMTDDYKAK